MASYLERYRNGEREQVWQELIALGDRARDEPIASDARAVATETMRRARRNIETLYERLQSIGYQFQCEKQRTPVNPFDEIRSQVANDPLLKSTFGGLLGGLLSVEAQLNRVFGSPNENAQPVVQRAFMPPPADIAKHLDTFERKIGPLPLSVRAWCEVVGSVDFMGDYPGLASYERPEEEETSAFQLRSMLRQILAQNPAMREEMGNLSDAGFRAYLDENPGVFPFSTESMIGIRHLVREEIEAAEALAESLANRPAWWVGDPLTFFFDIDAQEARWLIEEEDTEGYGEPGTFMLTVAPDELHKANISGSTYDIVLPNGEADIPLHGTDSYFIAYLRNSLAWGGFPGLADHEDHDKKLIAFLKEDLEPI